jgi:fatty-acyl-CoA synthase
VTYGRLIVDALTRFSDRPAFVQEGRTYTYAQAADLVGRMRAVLAGRGVGLASAVGALSPNRAEVWLAQAAAWLLGARYSGLHPLGSEDDHVFVCDDAQVEALVVDPVHAERAAAIAARAQTIKHVFTLGPAEVGEDLLALAEQAGPQRLDPGPAGEDDVAWLIYTGGTTGRPKGVMAPHRALVQQVLSFIASWQLPDRPRYLAASPITHAAAVPLFPTLVRGGTVLLHQGFDPDRWLRAVQDDRVTYAIAVPTMIYVLLDHGAPERYDLSSLHTVAYGASPMAPARLVEAHERIGPVFLQGYGQAECTGTATTLLKEEHDPAGRPHLLASCGRAVVGADVRVLDGAHQEVDGGEVGEICVRSRAVMSGYWQQPDLTAEWPGAGSTPATWRGGTTRDTSTSSTARRT